MAESFFISYRINSNDEIVFVNDEWSQVAIANDAPELVTENVLNSSLWDHIADPTTEHLYQQIVQRVRAGNNLQITIRCDAPDSRRLLSMKVDLKENKEVEFAIQPVSLAARESQKMLHRTTPRDERKLILCSWCNRVEIAEGEWREIEEALDELKLFHSETLPQLSHGMCVQCYCDVAHRIKT